ncbi:hypothetical protein H4Q32_020291 [Labeo rohita]|uniref:DRBM domain-containing protein n=1 Tax=Labeo rohita TaxID=84645 RepID=A0ABQ8LEE0_LABRO|nr:hypothetical protein H4Q32_020291 [Labeo rohita]
MILESCSYFLAQFGPQTLQRSVNGFSPTRERGSADAGYHYPVPKVFYVQLTVGNNEFIGEGRTRQAARHNAAMKALQALKNEPIPERPPQEKKETEENSDASKSEISLVYEIALKRNLPVNFERYKRGNSCQEPPILYITMRDREQTEELATVRHKNQTLAEIPSLPEDAISSVADNTTSSAAMEGVGPRCQDLLTVLVHPMRLIHWLELPPTYLSVLQLPWKLCQKANSRKLEVKGQKEESVQQTWPKGQGERERDWNDCCSHFCMHVLKESGPPHMKSFLTRVTVGEFSAEGEGNSKKLSKKRAALSILQELKKLPALPVVEKPKVHYKKRPKTILKTGPEYGQGMNPISRLAQIQQAKKEKEPEYMLLSERGMPRRREFIMQVKVGTEVTTGTGPNKKVAKRNAAEAMLLQLGYKASTPLQNTPEKFSVVQSGVEVTILLVAFHLAS